MTKDIKCPSCGSIEITYRKARNTYICDTCNYEFSLKQKFIPKRIFLSYGHDQHAPLAEKLKKDLEKIGHSVWFDKSEIKGGKDWEIAIEEGLAGTDAVLAMLTPHAVRRPDGVCLDEISFARFHGKQIFPLMVQECQPPLSISRIQWLDMQDWRVDERYLGKFKEICDTIEGRLPCFEGSHVHLLKELQPIDFGAEIDEKARNFYGRKWIFDAIGKWLEDPSASRVFFLTGGPGVGKSAIVARLCKQSYVVAYHLCSFSDTIKSDALKCVLSLTYQLSTQIPEYRQNLLTYPLQEVKGHNARTAFDQLIVQPLCKIAPPQQKLIIVIDALDEASHDRQNELVDFLAEVFDLTPSWLRLLITSRPEQRILNTLSRLKPYKLDTTDPQNLDDIANYLRNKLPEIVKRPVPESTITSLLKSSEGIFLYVKVVLEEIEINRLSPDRPEEFPQGIRSYYKRFFARQFSDPEDRARRERLLAGYDRYQRPLLEIIAAAQVPLAVELIGKILKWETTEDKKRCIDPLGSLFEVRNNCLLPFHQSVIEWLTEETTELELFIDRKKGHKRLAEFCGNEYKTGIASMSPYAVAYTPIHLVKLERWEELETVLTDLKYIEAKCRAGMTYELVKDYDVAMSEIPEGRAEGEEAQRREEEIKRYTNEIIEYARKWSEARDRHAQDPAKYPIPKPGDIPLPNIIQSVKPWTDEEIEADTHKFIKTPTRLHKLKIFSQFVNGETHNLTKYHSYPLFCVQQAYNSAKVGPVHDTARKILENDFKNITILNKKPSLPPFNPHPATLRILEGHTSWVRAVSLTPDGRRAVSGSNDNTLRVWDIESGQCLRTLEGHTDQVNAVSLTPDGRRAVSGSNDKTLRVWDVESGQCLRTLEGHWDSVSAVSLTPDGRRAISGGGYDKPLRVWDVESGQCLHTLEGHTDYVGAVSLTPDGRRAVSGSDDNTLRVWDVESGLCLRTLKGHWGLVVAVSLTPDGRRAVSGGSLDKTLRVWDVESGQCLRTLEGHTDRVIVVSLTPDGRRAVSGSYDNTLRMWDVESGQYLRTLEGHTDWVSAVNLTPDGRRAVSGSNDKTLRVWDVESGQGLRTLEGHTDRVNAVSLTPDGRRAVSGSYDKTLRMWDVVSGQGLVMIALSAHILTIAIKYPQIIAGLSSGNVNFLEIPRLKIETPIITPIRFWLYGIEGKQGKWDDNITALCEWCGKRLVPEKKILDTILGITRDARLSPNDSPCLKLPAEAFNNPRLTSACPHCYHPLKFNPFVVDNRERY